MNDPEFDLEKVYDAKILPLLLQVTEACRKHKIPFVAAACFGNSSHGADLAIAGCGGGGDWIPDELKVMKEVAFGEMTPTRNFRTLMIGKPNRDPNLN